MTRIILILNLLILSCVPSQNEDIEIIDNFLSEVVIKGKRDKVILQKFLDIDITNENSIKATEFYLDYLNNRLNEKDKVKIITYPNFIIKEDFKDYNIVYDGEGSVFCVLYKNKFITPIILNSNGKIVSFFTGIIKNKSKIHPVILNDIKN